MRLYTIIDPKYDQPLAGLCDIPADHPQIMMLIPEKPLSRLEIGERVACRSTQRDAFYVLRTK